MSTEIKLSTLAAHVISSYIFGVTIYVMAKVSCVGESAEDCYISEDAWIIMPMFMVPGLITQILAYPITKKIENIKSFGVVSYMLVHTIILVFLGNLWLYITDQGRFAGFTKEIDIPVVIRWLNNGRVFMGFKI